MIAGKYAHRHNTYELTRNYGHQKGQYLTPMTLGIIARDKNVNKKPFRL